MTLGVQAIDGIRKATSILGDKAAMHKVWKNGNTVSVKSGEFRDIYGDKVKGTIIQVHNPVGKLIGGKRKEVKLYPASGKFKTSYFFKISDDRVLRPNHSDVLTRIAPTKNSGVRYFKNNNLTEDIPAADVQSALENMRYEDVTTPDKWWQPKTFARLFGEIDLLKGIRN
ncbi:MAG: hypothetical protein LBK53_03540 [Heliobacteriaceae bacterium]|jgi:hypothetical protein|nr:hypothetical protein [Heliobacteriaceae bacterium]